MKTINPIFFSVKKVSQQYRGEAVLRFFNNYGGKSTYQGSITNVMKTGTGFVFDFTFEDKRVSEYDTIKISSRNIDKIATA